MKVWCIGWVLVLATIALAGCGGGEATPEPVDEGVGETYTSAVLDTSYEGALNVSNQLALGTIQLEETNHAVTPGQAAELLPLWQALQGGVTAQAEVDAVLRQIEGTMTPEQLAAIAAMQLTREDLQAWMQEQGLGFGGQEQSPELRATRQAESGGEAEPGGGWVSPGGEMPPEMATRRAEMENMSEEEREALRATVQAGGGLSGRPGGGGGAGGRQFIVLLNPLIKLLEARAGET